MKKQNTIFLGIALLLLLSAQAFSEANIYSHFTLVEGDVFIFKSNQDQAIKAVVNYPLTQGDIVYSNGNGRCELQFNNGTIMRMGHQTELQLTTVLSPSLTSNKKITTIHLNKGYIFSMNQTYNREIFQLITPAVSVKMNSRSTHLVSVDKDSTTRIYVIRGKVSVMFDEKAQTPKTENIKAGNGYRFNGNHMTPENKNVNPDFLTWNQHINSNFKEIHYGKSLVPPVIYRRSPGIVHFAEKFSTRFGTWVYDELFGYVWKPAKFIFKDKRPFFDANYVKVGGELVLVPNQPWGWAPANLGNWFWSKKQGWIWIPGDAFSKSICRVGLKNYPWDWLSELMFPYWTDPIFSSIILLDPYWNWLISTPAFWIHQIYGNLDLYFQFREGGAKIWRQKYTQTFNRKPPHRKPVITRVPESIKSIINRMNRVPLASARRYFSELSPATFKTLPLPRIRNLKNQIKGNLLPEPIRERISRAAQGGKSQPNGMAVGGMDWNPDARWSQRFGIDLYYSNRNNDVVCPELNISSRTLKRYQKSQLKRSTISRSAPVSSSASGVSRGSASNNPPGSSTSNTRQSSSSQSSSAHKNENGSGKK